MCERHEAYRVIRSGVNTLGNYWFKLDYGSSAVNQNCYYYINKDGSTYHSNPDGSTCYDSGNGYIDYTTPDGGGFKMYGDTIVTKESL